jgi:acyl transferase domain-containing protein
MRELLRAVTFALIGVVTVGCPARPAQPQAPTAPSSTMPTSIPSNHAGQGFIDAAGWTARVEQNTLIVEGAVTVAAANYAAELAFQNLQESVPPQLTLRLIMQTTCDFGAQVISERTVRYVDRRYTNVGTIRIDYPNGQTHEIRSIQSAR